MRSLLLAVAALGLAACATSTPYQPASDGRYGFEEQQIEANRVRITFRGNSITDRETVESYLLYRAAEVTLEHGKDYFVLVTRDTEEHSRLEGTSFPDRPFRYWGYRPGFGWSRFYDPFWNEPERYREVTRYEAIAEIAMFNGQKPADNADAYDAREVQANLQSRIVRAPPPGS
ncbi:CC0125/CC1285 family lipoprotein [Terricaulis sp.]|uniref:CC0125/CC1285 family lipoprotein n=1 Tax=Terricaulis sp. TaxID=2768686 RepID=UPI003784D773